MDGNRRYAAEQRTIINNQARSSWRRARLFCPCGMPCERAGEKSRSGKRLLRAHHENAAGQSNVFEAAMRIKGNDFFFAALFETKPCGEMRRTARSQFFMKTIFQPACGQFAWRAFFACTRDTALMTAALPDVAARCKIACTGRAFKYPQARWACFAWRAFLPAREIQP